MYPGVGTCVLIRPTQTFYERITVTPAPTLASVLTPVATPTPTPVPATTLASVLTPVATLTPTPVPATTSTPTPTPTPVPPAASFSVDVESGSAPITVSFDNTFDGPTTSMEWDFGDGATSTEQNPDHIYTIAGVYTVQLIVSGPGGSDTVAKSDLITVHPGPPMSLEVAPSTTTLAVGKTTQFAVVARDEFGNVTPDAVTWAIVSEGGSIGDEGRFSAGTVAGTFADAVKATLQSDGGDLAATASVTVEPGHVSTVVVEPSEVGLAIGSTQPFTFAAFDEFGNEISDVLSSWSALDGVGVIDTDGLLTAGTRAGAFLGAIRVDVVKGADRASASADVGIEPDPLATIKVDPSFTFVERWARERFAAEGFDQFGNKIRQLAMLWEATGGTITQTGLFTAGGEFGSYEVMVAATLADSTRTVSAAVQVIPPGQVSWWSVPTPTPTAAAPVAEVKGKQGGVLRTQVFGFPAQTFSPHVNWQAFVFSGGVYNLLVEFDPTTPHPFDIRPDLAKSWALSEDSLTWTFRLHENAMWHDGTPVTAEDVVFSLDRMTRLRGASRTPLTTYYESGNSRAIDQHTVAVTTKFPTSDLLAVLAMESSQMVAEHLQKSMEEGQTLGQPWDKAMGSGPFKPGILVRDLSLELVKNEDYWKEGFPLLDGLKHVVIIEKAPIIAAYKTGQVLMSSYPITNLTTGEALTLDEESPNLTTYFTLPNNTFPIHINTRRAPFDDPRVRQAMNLAFHRQAIRDAVGHVDVGAVAPPILGIRSAGPWGRTEEEISKLPGYRELGGEKHPDDIAAARQLLANAGFPDGFTTTILITPTGRPVVFPLFADQLKEYLNITLKTEQVDQATMGRRIGARDMDLWVDTEPPQILSPDNWLFQAYMPLSGPAITSGWEVPRWFQDRVQEQAQERDPEKRVAMIRVLEDFLINEDPGPWIVMFWEARHVIVNDRVKGFNMPALSVAQLKFEHLWCDPSC